MLEANFSRANFSPYDPNVLLVPLVTKISL
jgi:hypothetical protein